MDTTIRADRIPVADYISKQFLAAENESVWPRVWLMACREEEIARPGSYLVFDVVRDTILLVRQADGAIRAFHNVCQHRGRKLKEGCGTHPRHIGMAAVDGHPRLLAVADHQPFVLDVLERREAGFGQHLVEPVAPALLHRVDEVQHQLRLLYMEETG